MLINNAGITRGASVLDRDTSALRAELETNLLARWRWPLRSPIRSAKVRGHRQCRLGTGVGAFRRSYSVSKAALWSATDSMRLELAPRGVQVVGVYVGLVDTDMASFSDSPKSAPADVIRQVLDGWNPERMKSSPMSSPVRSEHSWAS